MGEDITERFDPIEVDGDGTFLMTSVREMFKDLVRIIEQASRAGRAQSVAWTELESAHRAVNRAIAEAHRKGG